MRYIDIDNLEVPAEWRAKSAAASAAVAAGTCIVNDRGDVWRDLKDNLAKLSHEKCWYCETKILRSDNAVDHFRPKNRVFDASRPHNGYTWLAFEVSNFRYSCTWCNSHRKDQEHGTSGGKADRFPLIDESKRVYVAGPTDGESPVLLDPIDPEDYELLTFDEAGQPLARYREEDDVRKLRAEESIKIYHLHEKGLCEERRKLGVKLVSEIQEAKRLFIALARGEANLRSSFKNCLKQIRRYLTPDAPYTGFAHAILEGHRDSIHTWVDQILAAP